MAKPDEKIVYCQVDALLDSNPKIRRAGRDGRDIFEFLLRRVALGRTEGTVPAKYIEPWYLADVLMMTEDEARHGTSRAVTARLIEVDEVCNVIRIVGWSSEWGRRPKLGSERTAEWREREALKSQESRAPVTSCDDVRRDVTVSDESDALDQRRSEEKRSEERRGDQIGSPASPSPKRKVRLSVDWTPRPEEQKQAASVGLECAVLVSEFRDHHTAKGSVMADWNAAFRTWIRNAVRFSRGGRAQSKTPFDLQMERVRILEEQGEPT